MQKKRIKVLQFLHGFGVGGAEKMVKQYCELFEKEKIDLVVLCIHNYHSILDQELMRLGIRVIYINEKIDKYIFGPTVLKKPIHRLLRKYMVGHYIKKENPDIIHLHLFLNNCLLKAKPDKSKKIFYTVHFEPQKFQETKEGIKEYRAIKKLCKNYDIKIIALHEEAKVVLNNLFQPSEMIVLNNGINVKLFQNVGSREELRKIFKIKQDLVVIGHVGGFRSVKNHEFLIDIFREMLQENENMQLWLVGDGGLSEKIHQKVIRYNICDKVIFWGIRNDIPNLMKMMNIMVFPSYSEGLSLTLVETQIVGIPALVSNGVSRETMFSNYIHFYSLEKTAAEWALEAFKIMENKEKIRYENIEKWDIESNVRVLQDIYFRSMEKG